MGQLLHLPVTRRIVHDVRRIEPEAVADLLLALEKAPDVRPTVFAVRAVDGGSFVAVRLTAETHRLTPGEARLAADALVADQAYPGCVSDANALIDGARAADRHVLTGRGRA